MFLRLLFSTLVISLSLFAAPSIEEMRAAVMKNPALLDTPEAQAMMKEKGLSKADVKGRLYEKGSTPKELEDENSIENDIDMQENNETEISIENEDLNTSENNESNETLDEDKELLQQRLNPFEYKTAEELREMLNSQHQLLIQKKLSRYVDRFYANKNSIDSASMPTPDDYTISSGDTLNIHIYGDRDTNYELIVSNDGEIELEYIGPLRVGGMSFKELKSYLSNKLKHHFKMSSFKISISKYSSIQVTLIGDVKYPGIYNLSSFATAKDLLIEAKGVRDSASVRSIDIKRNGKTVAKLDFYDLLFQGKNIGSILLKHGDIVVVNKAEKLVSIDGYVNDAAIFELKGDETLRTLINYAGGMKADASRRHIKVDRYSHNSVFETFHIPYSKAKNFKMQDGDKVYIYQLDSSANTNVSIYGNIIRPGTYPLGKSTTLHALLKKQLIYGPQKFFLPETYLEYGIVKHYSTTLNYTTQSFNLSKVIKGEESVKLNPQDEIYIFSQSDVQTSKYITTKGDILINEGKLRYFEGMTIRDAVHGAGLDGVIDDMVRVTTINTPNRMPKTFFYSFKDDGGVTLSPYDEVEIYDYYKTHLLQPVSISGEVVNPTTVFYETGMTLSDLLLSSGGFTIEAYLSKVEIVRYFIDKDSNRKKRIIVLDLNKLDKKTYMLQAYDEVTIYKIPNWGEKRVVTLNGEVKFPGKYTVSNGEKLSSVIERAGGFTDEAFIEGSVFTRDSIRKRQVKQYQQSLARIKRELAIYNAMPANAKTSMASVSASDTLNDVILEAQKFQPIGRVSIELMYDIDEFKDSQYDLVLKDKDELTIPNQIDTVTVFGEVFNPTSFIYNSDLAGDEYIEMASGLSRSADEGSIYIIHANGTSELLDAGWFSSEAKIQKGDTIVVPLYIKEYNTLEVWNSIAKVLSSFAVTAAALSTLGVL